MVGNKQKSSLKKMAILHHTKDEIKFNAVKLKEIEEKIKMKEQ